MTKKNKIRILGFLCLLLGISIGYFSENTFMHFIAGALVGFGIITLITGKIAIIHRL